MSPIERLILNNQSKLLRAVSMLLNALEASVSGESLSAKHARELSMDCEGAASEVDEVLG